MLVVLIVLLVITAILLAIFLSIRRSHKKREDFTTTPTATPAASAQNSPTNPIIPTVDGIRGVGGHFVRCDPPLFARNIRATGSNAKESKCYDPRSCPPGTTFNNATGFCTRNTLVRSRTDECACPAGWGFSNNSDRVCRQRTCPPGWKLDDEDICMLENPIQPLALRAANSNLNLFDETGKLSGGNLAEKAGCGRFMSYLDGGFCIQCPANTWGSNINNKGVCVNDTGIRAGFSSNTMPPTCATKDFKETFVASPAPDPWSWNKWNDRLSVRCLSNTVYDKSYNRCYSNLRCPAGQQRAGELGCGVEAQNHITNNKIGTRCVCPPGYGLEAIEDRVCKKAVCQSNTTLSGQVCEERRPTQALSFAGRPQNWQCPDASFTRVIQGLPNIGIRQNNVTNVAACVKCPQGFQPAPGTLDSKGTTQFFCSSNAPVGWDAKDTKEARCGV